MSTSVRNGSGWCGQGAPKFALRCIRSLSAFLFSSASLSVEPFLVLPDPFYVAIGPEAVVLRADLDGFGRSDLSPTEPLFQSRQVNTDLLSDLARGKRTHWTINHRLLIEGSQAEKMWGGVGTLWPRFRNSLRIAG